MFIFNSLKNDDLKQMLKHLSTRLAASVAKEALISKIKSWNESFIHVIFRVNDLSKDLMNLYFNDTLTEELSLHTVSNSSWPNPITRGEVYDYGNFFTVTFL
jgi:hypothetical protein